MRDLNAWYTLVDRRPVLATPAAFHELRKTNNWIVAIRDADGVRVSTVFIGLDHAFAQEEAPIVFETMVFGGSMDGECRRYASWEEAEAGHAAMVDSVQYEIPNRDGSIG